MLRRRVPVLRLGARGPGGDQKSSRLCPQAFAKRSRVPRILDSRKAGVLVAKRRVTGIGGGPGRKTQSCRHFWSLLAREEERRGQERRREEMIREETTGERRGER